MISSKKLIRKLFQRFPYKIAKKYHDYVGLMVGPLAPDIDIITLCLDVTDEVIKKAIENGSQLIISHHPFLYGSKKRVLETSEIKKRQFNTLKEHQIAVYSFHTNFDEGKDGMNDALATQLCLKNIVPLSEMPMGRIGELEHEMEIHRFAKYAKEKLDVDYGLLLDYGKPAVKKVAIIGGGGSGFYLEAIKDQADIYISGDAPHHVRRDIIALNYNYLDLPHEIEKIFTKQMANILKSIDAELVIYAVNDQVLPKVV